ncbi:MAG: circularly permuted type 2 ATP-grasp protein [Rhodospirillum sp.]|nr:circularly permuted type 2 ATP-grasp protein [Rhodospirillum sp.]MCF8487931.1 circularly permuted type 2 ATP-grasp protein [Rhodospirillum sp.]MCF8500668.1 circularly permuted type 2 ATP-grasp protein [Rhodospirillum sp.]
MPSSPFDEMTRPDGRIRKPYSIYNKWVSKVSSELLSHKNSQADLFFRRIGITFAVYGDTQGGERLIPFDVVPRIIAKDEWDILSKGVCQRVDALNKFIHDIYHGQEIVKAGKLPKSLLKNNDQFRPEMVGFEPPKNVYVQIAGVDVVRTNESEFHVLEDNLRTPSGVSYMLENRDVMTRLFPELFDQHPVAPVNHYAQELLETLQYAAPDNLDEPTVVLLTPGQYNSAYFEHAFLADEMGIELVQGQDLFVDGGYVYMRTVGGPRRVDVIYRRIDDDFLDPMAFRKDSMLGVPGLFEAYKKGHVTLANAVGTGIADDKAIYDYVPQMIDFYLGEKPILKNVHTYHLDDEDDRKYVLEHLSELVVKEVHGSGGYGMLVGPKSSSKEISDYKDRILDNPANFIAQPTLALSTCPTYVDQGIAPRHVDLRPFVLSGKTTKVVPGGLTRVALKEGSLVVNSSQGGGTKDTWVLER